LNRHAPSGLSQNPVKQIQKLRQTGQAGARRRALSGGVATYGEPPDRAPVIPGVAKLL